MTLALLILVVLLLLAIVAMLATGWPGRERQALDAMGSELRRELAQHRSDTIQLLHGLRMELDATLRESIEKSLQPPPRAGKRRSSPRRAAAAANAQAAATPAEEPAAWAEPPLEEQEERQLPLFADLGAPDAAQLPPEPPEPEEEMIRVYAADDLPDV